MTTAEIHAALASFADPVRLAFAKRTYPSEQEILGVTVPNVKSVLKEVKALSKTWAVEEQLSRALDLVKSGTFECQQLGLEWVSGNKKLLNALDEKGALAFMVGMDNWVSVDTYSCGILGCRWRDGAVSDQVIQSLLSQDDLWQRRLGIVATVALNLKSRGGMGDATRTLWAVEQTLTDHRDLINKANSWALRQLSTHEPDVVRDFLAAHGGVLHKKVVREVSSKLDTGTKRGS